MATTIFTIGHSTYDAQSFIKVLQAFRITALVDVRSIPRSRHNPDFNQDTFPIALSEQDIKYFHFKELGGRRHAAKNSCNTGWRNSSFRGYADYMQLPEFTTGLEALIKLANEERVAIMCAEAVPWRCHRSLIADALLTRGIVAKHILLSGKSYDHTLTPFARVKGLEITYPAETNN